MGTVYITVAELNGIVERRNEGVEEDRRKTILCRGGYSGRKLHMGSLGSSCLSCGHWLRAPAATFAVKLWDLEQVRFDTLCEKCFPASLIEAHRKYVAANRAPEAEDLRETMADDPILGEGGLCDRL